MRAVRVVIPLSLSSDGVVLPLACQVNKWSYHLDARTLRGRSQENIFRVFPRNFAHYAGSRSEVVIPLGGTPMKVVIPLAPRFGLPTIKCWLNKVVGIYSMISYNQKCR